MSNLKRQSRRARWSVSLECIHTTYAIALLPARALIAYLYKLCYIVCK